MFRILWGPERTSLHIFLIFEKKIKNIWLRCFHLENEINLEIILYIVVIEYKLLKRTCFMSY